MSNNQQNKSVRTITQQQNENAEIWLNAGSDVLSQLDSLFKAIQKESKEHSQINKRAELGSYVAFDMANNLDVAREDFAALQGGAA